MKFNSLEASVGNLLKNFRGWTITKTQDEKKKEENAQEVTYLLTSLSVLSANTSLPI